MKAAFLYKFTGYVDWPEAAFERPDAPFVMGVLGAPVLLAALSELVVGRSCELGVPAIDAALNR